MKKKGVLKNLIVGFASKIIVIALGFIIQRIILVNYGSDVNGIINSIGQIFSYMALLEAGIGLAAKDMLYKPIVKNDREGISYVATVAQRYFNRCTILYALGVILMAIIIPLTWKSSVDKSIIFCLIIFEGMSGVFSFLFNQTPIAILKADGKSYVVNSVGMIRTILGQVAKIIIVSLSIRIDALQLSYCLITIIQILIYKFYFKKNYSWLSYKAAPKTAKLANRSAYVTAEIAWVVFSSTDLIILSTFADTMVSSVYSVYSMIFGSFTTILNTLYNSISYVLGQTYHKDIEQYKRVHDAYNSLFLGVLTILMSVTYLLIIPFIKLYTKGVSDINYVYEYVPLMFGLIQLLSVSSYVTKNLTNIGGYAKQGGKISVVEAIINVSVSLLLVKKLGIYGVLFATVVALPLKTVYCAYVSDKKILNRSCKKTCGIFAANYLLYFAVVMAEKYIRLNLTNYLELIFAGAVLTVICTILGILVNVIANRDCIYVVKNILKKS